jgi:hypothetical protein
MVVYIMTDTPNETALFEASANPVETGLAPVTGPVTSVAPALPEGWDVPKFLELIDALARNLYDASYTVKHFNLTEDQFAALSANEWFKKAVEVARVQWSKAENVHQRLAIQTALVIEKNLPAMSKRMGSPTEPLTGVVALAKLFAEIAGSVGNPEARSEAPREKFKIIFNLGADMQSFEKDRPLVQIASELGQPDATAANQLALEPLAGPKSSH